MESTENSNVEERLQRLERIAAASGQVRGGYEYKSSVRLLGLPLVHVASGENPKTGGHRMALGIIAIGDFAFGVLAIGGISMGVISIGGISLALLFALGGLAFAGGVAAGGAAVGGYLALGGFAISWHYAIGGFAVAPHPFGSNYQDPAVIEKLKEWFPDWKF